MSRYDERFDSWFRDRRWRVCTEVTETRPALGYTIYIREGFLRLEPPGVYRTPFGGLGRSGYLVREVGPDGKDLPGKPVTIGRKMLERAIARYGAVSGLPAKDPRTP